MPSPRNEAKSGDDDDRAAQAKGGSDDGPSSPVKPEVGYKPCNWIFLVPACLNAARDCQWRAGQRWLAGVLFSMRPKPRRFRQAGERPPTGKLLGYTQTYLIFKDRAAPSSDHDGDGKEATEDQCEHEVLFRCGNW
jgi:hypothetical protein